jgi:hypothetical protein
MTASSAIRDSARGETCTFMIAGVCNFGTETTVYCHGSHPDKGTGYKSHPASELWGAYGCYPCHLAADNRAHPMWQSLNFWQYWHDAIRETQRRLIAKGLLRGGKK